LSTSRELCMGDEEGCARRGS
jgi:hypothetical protein